MSEEGQRKLRDAIEQARRVRSYSPVAQPHLRSARHVAEQLKSMASSLPTDLSVTIARSLLEECEIASSHLMVVKRVATLVALLQPQRQSLRSISERTELETLLGTLGVDAHENETVGNQLQIIDDGLAHLLKQDVAQRGTPAVKATIDDLSARRKLPLNHWWEYPAYNFGGDTQTP
jgi:hypothetical protein